MNIIIVGDTLVGKNAIATIFEGSSFPIEPRISFAEDEMYFKTKIKKNLIYIKLIVACSQLGFERYLFNNDSLIKKMDGIILVIDLTKEISFIRIKKIIEDNDICFDIPLVLFINKIDLVERDSIFKEEILEFAKKNNLPYFEMSAKTKQGINEGLSYEIEKAYHLAEKKLNIRDIQIPKNDNDYSGCPGMKKNKNK